MKAKRKGEIMKDYFEVRAIHTYEKNGYEIAEPTMFLMKRKVVEE